MRALVLSGGGPLAVAWESGLVAGLASGGVRLSDADMVLGTSAGAIVGAGLRSGADSARMAESILREANGIPPPGARPFPLDAVARLPALFAASQGATGNVADARAAVGAHALEASTEDEAAYVARMALGLLERAWPEKGLGCVAVDVADGSIVVLTRDCGAPLDRAVAASCSLPGLSPPVEIAGRRYMDGGFASSANADLALGYEVVLVIAFQPPGPAGDRMAARLDGQLTRLRDAGASVLALTPDPASQAAIGTLTMDVRRRPEVARVAIAQGQEEAAMVAAFWSA